MLPVLNIIPIFALLSGILIYRLNGRKEIFRLDMVQFFYSFILAPVLYVWAKSFLFVLLRNELNVRVSQGELFLFDTIFSVIFLYIFAFIVIHSLTKSFNLKTAHDPLYDIFHHSEYFHLWLSHLVIYIGGMAILTVFSTLSLFFPTTLELPKVWFYLLSGSGVIWGVLMFLSVWLSDPKQSRANFMRFMKLVFGLFFLLHVAYYFFIDPRFNAQYIFYWWSLFFFATLVVVSFFTYRSERARLLVERVSNWFKHRKWDTRIDLFK